MSGATRCGIKATRTQPHRRSALQYCAMVALALFGLLAPAGLVATAAQSMLDTRTPKALSTDTFAPHTLISGTATPQATQPDCTTNTVLANLFTPSLIACVLLALIALTGILWILMKGKHGHAHKKRGRAYAAVMTLVACTGALFVLRMLVSLLWQTGVPLHPSDLHSPLTRVLFTVGAHTVLACSVFALFSRSRLFAFWPTPWIWLPALAIASLDAAHTLLLPLVH